MADTIDKRIGQFVFSETERAVKKELSLNKRITSVENLVGDKSVKDSIDECITTDFNDTDKVPTVGTVKQAIDDVTFTKENNSNQYQSHLYTFTDNNGNVLAYFDINGNFCVNGAVISTNL